MLDCDFRLTVAIAMSVNFAPIIMRNMSGVYVSRQQFSRRYVSNKQFVVIAQRIERHICGYV